MDEELNPEEFVEVANLENLLIRGCRRRLKAAYPDHKLKGRIDNTQRNKRILALRGLKSFGLIAQELGISRNAVAAVCWREDWPRRHTCGRGRTGNTTPFAKKTLRAAPISGDEEARG